MAAMKTTTIARGATTTSSRVVRGTRSRTAVIKIKSMIGYERDWPASTSLSKYEDLQHFFQTSAKSPATIKPKRSNSSSAEQKSESRRDVSTFALAGPPQGEWPATYSQTCYDALAQHFHDKLFKKTVNPEGSLSSVMTLVKHVARADDKVSAVLDALKDVSGLPVIDDLGFVVGVLSHKDITTGDDEKSVADLMSSPAITIEKKKTVADAAGLMLKHKVHRIPVTDKSGKCVGIVTRTDIFEALGA